MKDISARYPRQCGSPETEKGKILLHYSLCVFVRVGFYRLHLQEIPHDFVPKLHDFVPNHHVNIVTDL